MEGVERGIAAGEDKEMRVKWITMGFILFLVISARIGYSEPGKRWGDIERGENLFLSKCASCHYTNSKDKKVGPGLNGIFKEKVLPMSKKPVTRENIRSQIRNPFANMPAVPGLSEQDIRDIIEYLRTL
jgi:cytochrome c2